MNTPNLFELVPLTKLEDLAMPDKGPYFVATKDGYMVMQPSHFGATLTPVKKIETLPEGTPALWKNIPKIPASVIGQAWSFFLATFDRMQSEAMVDITWDEEHGYRLFVPPQQASYGGVKATRNPEHIKGLHVGTIHSHCDFTAFHSGTDKHDADQHNGIHFTLGKITSDRPEVAVMISQSGEQWDLDPEEAVEGDIVLTPHQKRWESYVREPVPEPPKKFGSSKTSSLVVFHQNRSSQPKSGGRGSWFDDDEYWDALSRRYDEDRTRGYTYDHVYGTLESIKPQIDLADGRKEIIDSVADALAEAQQVLDVLGIDLDFEFRIQKPHTKPEADIPDTWRHLL